ncbi:MAG: hypothetical protein M1816_007172 [Peltula sp. TS41687]|nr:MAG: hypothetical protein M1816_007172 [Peltula sp. TS41687]
MSPLSPFPPPSSQPGHGTILTAVLPPTPTTLRELTYTYPLKLISPSPHAGAKSIVVFLLTYGGGLVSGDATRLSVTVGAASRLVLVTQGSTKIFKAVDRSTCTSQHLDVLVERDAALVYLPDPVQPFGESVYEQRQVFRVDAEKSANLCVLDWVSEGRTARGERWGLWGWRGRNEVWEAVETGMGSGSGSGRLLLRDNVILLGDDIGTVGTLAGRMDGLGVFGTLILRGNMFETLARFFLEEFSLLPRLGAKDWSHEDDDERQPLSAVEEWRDARQMRERRDGLLWTAAAVRGCTVVKFGAREVEGARRWLGDMIRREATVEREFGEESLLCLK